jgi:hypothetical protein
MPFADEELADLHRLQLTIGIASGRLRNGAARKKLRDTRSP